MKRWVRRVGVAVPVSAAAALLVGIAIWSAERANDPVEWLSNQDMIGICEAVASLRAFDAVRIDPAAHIDSARALAAAREALAAAYPDLDPDTVLFSQPLYIEAAAPAGDRAAQVMIYARLRDASPQIEQSDVPPDQRWGMAAVIYLAAGTGAPLRTITAVNVVDPYLACLRHLAQS
ncbi:MAG: hypothetical protein SF162_13610 [bacterium]|nr:hypothetical protein [bacterium]